MIKKKLMKTITLATLLILPCTMVQAQTVKLNSEKITINPKSTRTLKVLGTNAKIKWTSKNKKIATVTNGIVTGVSRGNTYITAKVGSQTLKCKVTIKHADGSRKHPFFAYSNNTFSVYTDSGQKKVQLRLLECIDGNKANEIIENEWELNPTPSSKNRWVLYHFQLKYLKGQQELASDDVIYDFYNDNSTRLLSPQKAIFVDELDGKSEYDVKLYSGGKDDFYIGLLLDKSVKHTTFRVRSSYNSELWFTTQK